MEMTVLQSQVAQLQADLRRALDESAQERAKCRQLEQKVSEMTLQQERAVAQKNESAMQAVNAIQQQLTAEQGRVRQLEEMLEALGNFANQKTSLTRRLQIAEQELTQKTAELKQQGEHYLTELARQRATMEFKAAQDVKTSFENGRKQAWKNINVDTALLKEQNIKLEKSMQLMRDHIKAPEPQPIGIDKEVKQTLERKLGQQSKQIEVLQKELDSERSQNRQFKLVQQDFNSKQTKQFEQERDNFRREVQALEKLIYVKCRELYRLRTVAAAILQKRSVLEQKLYGFLDESQQYEQLLPQTMSEMQDKLDEPVILQQQMEQREARATVMRWIQELDGQKM